MFKVIIALAFFVIVVYIYSAKKIKNNKEKTKNIDSIQEFHDTYRHLSGLKKNHRRSNSSGDYQKYITKYNSSEDYREKL